VKRNANLKKKEAYHLTLSSVTSTYLRTTNAYSEVQLAVLRYECFLGVVMSRDYNGHNFGLGARRVKDALHFAGKEAARDGAISETTVANAKSTYADFGAFLKGEKVYDLRNVTREHVSDYAEALVERVESGEIKWSAATEYLSRINAAMERASGVRDVRVTAQEAGFPKRDGIARESSAVQLVDKQKQIDKLSSQTQALLGLQREFGLRSKESILLDARAGAKLKIGDVLEVGKGTKGGRPRVVPIRTQAQLEALKAAAKEQQGKYTQIPKESSYRAFKSQLYQEVAGVIKQHGLRHAYAHDRYRELTGVECPVAAGVPHKGHRAWIAQQLGVSLDEAGVIDRAARLEIAEELGHGRISITNGYLG
jgi:integrase